MSSEREHTCSRLMGIVPCLTVSFRSNVGTSAIAILDQAIEHGRVSIAHVAVAFAFAGPTS